MSIIAWVMALDKLVNYAKVKTVWIFGKGYLAMNKNQNNLAPFNELSKLHYQMLKLWTRFGGRPFDIFNPFLRGNRLNTIKALEIGVNNKKEFIELLENGLENGYLQVSDSPRNDTRPTSFTWQDEFRFYVFGDPSNLDHTEFQCPCNITSNLSSEDRLIVLCWLLDGKTFSRGELKRDHIEQIGLTFHGDSVQGLLDIFSQKDWVKITNYVGARELAGQMARSHVTYYSFKPETIVKAFSLSNDQVCQADILRQKLRSRLLDPKLRPEALEKALLSLEN